jgi:hypothetical protein
MNHFGYIHTNKKVNIEKILTSTYHDICKTINNLWDSKRLDRNYKTRMMFEFFQKSNASLCFHK